MTITHTAAVEIAQLKRAHAKLGELIADLTASRGKETTTVEYSRLAFHDAMRSVEWYEDKAQEAFEYQAGELGLDDDGAPFDDAGFPIYGTGYNGSTMDRAYDPIKPISAPARHAAINAAIEGLLS